MKKIINNFVISSLFYRYSFFSIVLSILKYFLLQFRFDYNRKPELSLLMNDGYSTLSRKQVTSIGKVILSQNYTFK
jgi:hypothetical protein